MAVEDDLRRLTQLDSIYLGYSVTNITGGFTGWYKGRLQQANDGAWIFRSISGDGTVCGFQLGPVQEGWSSSEIPTSGIKVSIRINLLVSNLTTLIGQVLLQQQLPQELT
ncbi:MAG: hypothetical protein WB689_17460 [Xanthobacteraceae bacterium]